MDQACVENDLIPECVFSSDIDAYCQDSYEANFGERPEGDITKIDEKIFLIMIFYLQVFLANHLVLLDKCKDLMISVVLYFLTLLEL